MPEIKHNFTGGKMNKDVDQRLVPKGEYRDAMNIQVSTSEGSDVGTVQNILGNSAVVSDLGIHANSTCVGAVADEKNDALYWFVREPISSYNITIAESRDIIFELKNGNVKHVFVDKKQISIGVASLHIPSSGNIIMSSQQGFNAINVGDTFQLWQLGVNISGSEFYTVLSKDPTTLKINIGDYTNASWANTQAQGSGELQIVPFGTGGVLKFPENIITGINIIDDMLFWTDGITEPKKINIPRSIQGTPDGYHHTRLINPAQNISYVSGILAQEEHITVIRKAPTNPPELKMYTERSGNSHSTFTYDFTGVSAGSELSFNFNSTVNYTVGDIILIKDEFSAGSNYVLDHDVRVVVKGILGSTYNCVVLSIDSTIVYGSVLFASDLDKSYERLYALKFPRFATRYKYLDGEYSTFSPFSEIAFVPGNWTGSDSVVDANLGNSYMPTAGYNIGMENKLRELSIRRIIPKNIPLDVKQVDILYKESNSTNIYLVDEITNTDTYWQQNRYDISSETIKAVIPSNQFLRPWDNVPKNALSQEVTGNRIVYANYEQNYNLNNLRVSLDVTLRNRSGATTKSIKSIRNYQLGVIYSDTYNRQTPVLTDPSGSLPVSKINSGKKTFLEAKARHSAPDWASYYKFYIKETSSEYYNLALDRNFDAEDGNIWLSFSSNDRNKLDLEDTLFLKKKFNSNEPETTFQKYKIVDIKNEAPSFIKKRRAILGKVYQEGFNAMASGATVFASTDGGNPIEGEIELQCTQDAFVNTTLENFHKRHNAPSNDEDVATGGGVSVNTPIFIRISAINAVGSETLQKTNWHEVDNVSKTGDAGNTNPDIYLIRLKNALGSDAAWTNNYQGLSANSSADLLNLADDGTELVLEIGQDIEQDRSIFQGRFFVKILRDIYIEEAVVGAAMYQNQQVVATAKCGWLKDFDQEDVFSGNLASDWPHTKAGYAAEIADFNANGPANNPQGRDYCIIPETEFPLEAYWGNSVWHLINEKLENLKSRWVIDEGFAKGEEPLWSYHQFDAELETNSIGFVNSLEWVYTWPTEESHQYMAGSTLYAGYNRFTWGQALPNVPNGSNIDDIDTTTKLHNVTPTSQTVPGIPNTYGLGHGYGTVNGCSYNDNYEYYSTGRGVDNSGVEKTIDIAYIGPGEKTDTYRSFSDSTFESMSSADKTAHDSTYTSWDNFWRVSGTVDADGEEIGPSSEAKEAQKFIDNLVPGSIVRFKNDPNLILYNITNVKTFYKYNFSGHITDVEIPFTADASNGPGVPGSGIGPFWADSNIFKTYYNRRVTFRLTLECVVSPGADIGTDGAGGMGYNPLKGENTIDDTNLEGVDCPIEIITTEYLNGADSDVTFPDNPAIWETEPKEDNDLDIFHEITSTIPLSLAGNNGYSFAPKHSIVTVPVCGGNTQSALSGGATKVVSWVGNMVELSNFIVSDLMCQNMVLTFTRPDGTYTTATMVGLGELIQGQPDSSYFVYLNPDVSNNAVGIGWHNCYSFGNGVESNRIRDTFNSVFIDNGPKVSTTLEGGYEQEYRKYGLIYSGIYNSTGGVNNLNQFIAAEKITKDINPIYGSIQKLHSGWGQGGDLIALCEDRVLKILANKDALYNADGNTNVTSTNNVLGQAIPYSGEYGISKNPESFASEAYRAYFTDKVRGTVMRLSMDGLTPISNHGMKDWFRDHLKLGDKLIGSYDDKKDEYNITIKGDTIAKTVTFKEDVKGWVSFKSFTPENAISCANEYYTFKNGDIWRHHDELVDRNTFYNENLAPSSVEVIFNEVPGSVKSFKTVNYEGSQAKVTSKDENGVTLVDGEYFNLSDVDGWHVIAKDGVQGGVVTNLERGGITEFIKKEGKWFGYVIGDDITVNFTGNVSGNYDTEDFSIQGVGRTANVVSSIIFGCTDATMFNYNDAVTNDDGSCVNFSHGCMDPSADNFQSSANTDDGSCYYLGCTTGPLADQEQFGGSINYDPNATVDDGSCIPAVWGCTVLGYFNSNPLANMPSNYCIPFNPGCTDIEASNYIQLVDEMTDVNVDDGSCEYKGCTDPLATNYDLMFVGSTVDGPNGMLTYLNGTAIDDGSCTYIGGCMDATACNFDVNAQTDDGSCYFCGDDNAVNYIDASGNTPVSPDYTCVGACEYCEEVASVTITNQTTSDPGLDNGTVTIEWPASTLALYYDIIDSAGLISTIVHNPSGNATETLTITGLATGTYAFYVITNCYNAQTDIDYIAGYNLPGGVIGTGQYGTPVSITITTTATIGCIDNGSTYTSGVVNPANGTWGACNYDNTANADASGVIGGTDYSNCNYTDCVGCNDSSYVEYCDDCWDTVNQVIVASGGSAWVSDTVPTSCTTPIVSGCTDATAFNYDTINPPNADCVGVVGGTDTSCCQPVVNGCMDDTLNINLTYAASNYAGPGNTLGTNGTEQTPVANTDDGSCNPYNCPIGPSITAVLGQFPNTTLQFSFNTANTIYISSSQWNGPPYDFTVGLEVVDSGGGSIYSNTSISGFDSSCTTCDLVKTVGQSQVDSWTSGQTSITVTLTVDSNDGLCSLSETATFTVGCMDATANNYGSSLDFPDDSQCVYAGCTDALACNYNAGVTVDDGSCTYPGCTNVSATNYDAAAGCDDGSCIIAGCMDATPQADGTGYAASNYAGPGSGASPEATTPCNDTDPAQAGTGTFNASQDNGCCTYYADESVIFGDPNAIAGNGYAANTFFDVHYDIGSTGYTVGAMPVLLLGSPGGTMVGVAGQTKNGMNSTSASRLAHTVVPGVGGATSGPQSEWHNYVNNGSLLVTASLATFNGACDNNSLNDALPQGSIMGPSRSYTVGCRNDGTAVNYNANLDLHLDGSCVAVNPGCMDDDAWPTVPSNTTAYGLSGYDAAHNTACGTSGSTTDTTCCCFNAACNTFDPLGTITYNSGNQELTIPITLIPCARTYQYATRFYDGGWSGWTTVTDVPATQTTLGSIKEQVSVLWPSQYDNDLVTKQIKVRAKCTDAPSTLYTPWQQANVTYTY